MASLVSPTIASPHPTPSSSRRTSLDTNRSSPARASHPPSTHKAQPRRNRAALRDYYGLKSATPVDTTSAGHQDETAGVKESELDRSGFDAEAYVRGLLGKEGLEGVLKEEGSLINQIRFLDGERKALVYDNYSKLIAATETIRRMRANMDPLAPTTSTLAPAISHIAFTAAGLATKLQGKQKVKNSSSRFQEGQTKLARDRETVRWVLDSPRRWRRMEAGAAQKEWKDVQRLLEKWKGVDGLDRMREQCEKIMEEKATESAAEEK